MHSAVAYHGPCTRSPNEHATEHLYFLTSSDAPTLGARVRHGVPPPEGAAVVTSDLSMGSLAASAEQATLMPVPDLAPIGLLDAGAGRISTEGTPDALAPPPAVAIRKPEGGLRARLLALDIPTVIATWVVLGTLGTPGMTVSRRLVAVGAAILVTLTAMPLLGLYRSRLCVQRRRETSRIAVACIAGALTFGLVKGDPIGADDAVIVAAGSCILVLMTLRWSFGQWLSTQRMRGRYRRGIVMVGTDVDAVDVWRMLHSQPELGYEVRGIIGEPRFCPEWALLPNARKIDGLLDIAVKTGSTGVLVVVNALTVAEIRDVIDLSTTHGLHVQICPGFRGLAARRVRHVPVSGEAFLYVEPRRRAAWELAAKRAIDVIGAGVGLLVAAPILLLAWIAIRIDDNGPALYRQSRIGLHQQPFVVYKMRSMTLGAESSLEDLTKINERTDGPLFKAAGDPRVTRVGAVIRSLSVDEIPQLFNVLTGKMSLVGPRPALPEEVAQFDPELLRRHEIKPGVTGLWQLEARSSPSFHAYKRLDLLYVDNWSIGLDLMILAATVPTVIMHALRFFRPVPTPA
jgi:exopolysaccharide biosynthesis polyprenyl glycosylphosphotransferase